MLDAGASKEAPFVLEADASSDSPEEAQPYVYPPHLDGLRTHGDEVDVDSILAVAELQWPTSAFVGVIAFCFLAIGLSIFGWASYVDSAPCRAGESVPVPPLRRAGCVRVRDTSVQSDRRHYDQPMLLREGPEWDASLGPQKKLASVRVDGVTSFSASSPSRRTLVPEGRALGLTTGSRR